MIIPVFLACLQIWWHIKDPGPPTKIIYERGLKVFDGFVNIRSCALLIIYFVDGAGGGGGPRTNIKADGFPLYPEVLIRMLISYLFKTVFIQKLNHKISIDLALLSNKVCQESNYLP